MADHSGYADWRSLERAIKEAAKKAALQAGPGVSAATVDAQIRQARFDRFLSRVFADGNQSEWLLKGGEPANRLHLRRELVTHPYRLYPVTDQIADKVCATMDTNYPGGKRSSRVKDLVDLVVLAHTQSIDLGELRRAIDARQTISGIGPFEHFEIPTDWTRTYPATAKGVPIAETFSAATAAQVVAKLIDPALNRSPNTATWDPHELTWNTAAYGPDAAPG